MVGRSKRLQSTLPGAVGTPPRTWPPSVEAAAATLRQRVADDGPRWRAVLLRLLRDVSAEEGAVSSYAAVILYDVLGAHTGEDACRRGMLGGDDGLADVAGRLLDGCAHDVKGILKYCLAALVLLLRDEGKGLAADTGLAGRVGDVLGRLARDVAALPDEVQCLVVEALHWAGACMPGGVATAVEALRSSSLCAEARALHQ